MSTVPVPSPAPQPAPQQFSQAEGFDVFPRYNVPEDMKYSTGYTALLHIEEGTETVLCLTLAPMLHHYVDANSHIPGTTHIAFKPCDDTPDNHLEAIRLKAKYKERFSGIGPQGWSAAPRSP